MDPHHFEPTAADLARATEANVIVVGGGGYDAWLYDTIEDQDKIIHALPLTAHSHDHGEESAGAEEAHDHDHEHGEEGHSHEVSASEGNEHIWYDPTAVVDVAHEIAEHINEANPDAQVSDEELAHRSS